MERPNRKAIGFQVYSGIAVGLGVMTAGAWLAWPSKAVPLLRDGEECCKVSNSDLSWVVALMDLGNVLSLVPTSYLMDWLGRKTTLHTTVALYFIASILVFCANDIWYLFFARIFVGMALGVSFVVVPIYLTELASIEIRGALTALFIGFVNIGLFYDYTLGWLVSYFELNIANVVIPTLFFVVLFFVPESPYYLIMKAREKDAIASLAKLRQLKQDDEALLAEYNSIKSKVTGDMENKHRFWDVVTTKSNRRALIIISMLAIFQRTTGVSANFSYMTVTLPETGGGADIAAYMVIFSFILVIAGYAATPLVDSWGRRSLLNFSSLSTAFVQAVAGTYYVLREHDYDVDKWDWVPYACVVIFAYTYSLGLGFIPSTLVGELFPQNVKSYASSISAILLAATSFCVNKVFLMFPVHYMYFFYALACIASTIFCEFYVLETKGKTFQEIHEELRKLSDANENP